MSQIQKKSHGACPLLLVDGYDEISTDQQKLVSEALLKYQAAHIGKFYLTCREYYSVSQLSAPEVRLDEFTRDDQINFVNVFLKLACPTNLQAIPRLTTFCRVRVSETQSIAWNSELS
jgi:hypothetical protein